MSLTMGINKHKAETANRSRSDFVEKEGKGRQKIGWMEEWGRSYGRMKLTDGHSRWVIEIDG